MELYQKVWVGRFKSTGLSDADALSKWQSKSASASQTMTMMDAKWRQQHGMN
jgi:hypothetical protein